MSETRQWVERFDALRDDLATGDLYHIQKWVQNDGALTEIAEGLARLTRELEEARERERALREAHERSVGVFRRACEIAEAAIVAGENPETASARLRDAIEADIAEINALVALATPPAEGGGEAGVTTTATHQDSLQVDDGD